MGNLIHAGENYHRVVEIVRSGVLGKITKTRVWLAADRSGLGRPADGPPPAGLRLRLLARARPRRGRSIPTASRSTGGTSGTTAAASSPISAATSSTSSTGPWTSMRPTPSPPPAAATPSHDNAEVPDTLEVTYEYQKGDQKFLMVWSQTDASTHGLENQGLGIMFQGTEATLVADYHHYKIIPEKGRKDRRAAEEPAALGRPSPRVARRDQDAVPSARATSATAIA